MSYPVNCGWTEACAHRAVRATSVRGRAPLRNVTRAVTTCAARRLVMGTDARTERWPARTFTVRTTRPVTRNVMRRIAWPATVTPTLRDVHDRLAASRAIRAGDATCSPSTPLAGVFTGAAAAGAGAAGAAAAGGAGGAGAAAQLTFPTAIGTVALPPVWPKTVPIGPHHA